MQIIVIKLNTGEELIGQIDKLDDKGHYLIKPRVIQLMDRGNGQAGGVFVPPLLLANDEFPMFIPHSAVSVSSSNVTDQYEKNYLTAITGIQLATL